MMVMRLMLLGVAYLALEEISQSVSQESCVCPISFKEAGRTLVPWTQRNYS